MDKRREMPKLKYVLDSIEGLDEAIKGYTRKRIMEVLSNTDVDLTPSEAAKQSRLEAMNRAKT
jgi:hypothetical protein